MLKRVTAFLWRDSKVYRAAIILNETVDMTSSSYSISPGASQLSPADPWAWAAKWPKAWPKWARSLVLCARKKERCDRAAEELQRLACKLWRSRATLKMPRAFKAVAEATVEQFGRIDILINNAGTSWGAPVEAMTLEQWNKVIETNLTGTFLFSQAVGKIMIAQRRGKIINIASVAGLRGSSPKFSAIGYSASKGGVIIFTKDLACKWGDAQHPGECDRTWLVSDATCRKKSSNGTRKHSWQLYLWADSAGLMI